MKNYTEPKLHDFDGRLEKRWYIEYQFRHPETKKLSPFREWVSNTHKTRGERYEAAKKQIDRLNNELVLGFNPYRKEKICTTLIEAVNHVCNLKTQSNGKRTKTAYNSAAKKFTDWLKANHYADMQAREFSLPIGLMYFDNMLINMKVKPRTYNNNLATLRTLFNELEYRSYVNVNVFNKIRKLPKKKADLKFFTPEEKKIIYHALNDKNPRLLLAAYLVYYCMIRPAEIVRLRFSNLNFEKSYIMLPPSISKKSSGTVLMPSYVKELLLSLGYDKHKPEWYIFSNGTELTPGEKEIAPTRIAEVWKSEIKDKYKIKHGIYTLKHTDGNFLPQKFRWNKPENRIDGYRWNLSELSAMPTRTIYRFSLADYYNSIDFIVHVPNAVGSISDPVFLATVKAWVNYYKQAGKKFSVVNY